MPPAKAAVKVAWFVVFPASQQPGTTNTFGGGTFGPGNTMPTNGKIVSAQVDSPAYKAWLGNGAYTIKGTSWQVDAGPFASEAQAKAWKPGPISIGDWVGAGIAGVMLGGGNVPNPKAAVGAGMAVGTAVDQIGSFLTANWFLRIGEILLGVVLVGVGIARITGVQNFVSQIAKTKMPIPI